MPQVIAIVCSDIHLSHRPPVARSAEPDWYEAMARPLEELTQLSEHHDTSVIIAGDIFDRWNSPPQLINFAINHLPRWYAPKIYAIPGQHDLPNHRIEEAYRSAYMTLHHAGVIWDMGAGYGIIPGGPEIATYGQLVMVGFPWGCSLVAANEVDMVGRSDDFMVAVVHDYIWMKGHGHKGADRTKLVSSAKRYDLLKTYDAVVFGDNHSGFVHRQFDAPDIFNCGTFMRRRSDEINYQPQVGLLYEDGRIEPHYLDTSQDKFLKEPLAKELEQQEVDMSEFIEELSNLNLDSLDFRERLIRHMEHKGVDHNVRAAVLESIGQGITDETDL